MNRLVVGILYLNCIFLYIGLLFGMAGLVTGTKVIDFAAYKA